MTKVGAIASRPTDHAPALAEALRLVLEPAEVAFEECFGERCATFEPECAGCVAWDALARARETLRQYEGKQG